jgi:hypothetical protein
LAHRVLLVCLLLMAPALGSGAQTLESTYTIRLKSKQTTPGARGDHIVSVRITTKDVIEQFRSGLGIAPGSRRLLVVRRHIDDLLLQDAQEYLVVDGTYYPVAGMAEPLEMPATFQAAASRASRRRGWADERVDEIATGVFRMAGTGPQPSELAFSAFVHRRLLLLRQDDLYLGYRYTGLSWTIQGGLVEPDGEIMPVGGKLTLGREKLVAQ